MKKLTLISILLTAVALVAVGCTSQDALTPPDSSSAPPALTPSAPAQPSLTEPARTAIPTASMEQPNIQPSVENRTAIEATEPTIHDNDSIGATPEIDLNSQPNPSAQ